MRANAIDKRCIVSSCAALNIEINTECSIVMESDEYFGAKIK